MKRFLAIIFFLGFLVVFFGLVGHEYRDLEDNRKELEVLRTDLENKRDYSLGLEEVVDILETEYKSEILKFSSALPDDHYAPSFLSTIESLIYNSGMRIDNFGDFQSLNYSQDPRLRRTEFTFYLRGGYSNFKYLMNNIENMSRLVNIRNLRIESSGGEGLEYLVTLDIFSKQDEK